MPVGLQVRELVGVVRDVRHASSSTRPLVVAGVLAAELAKQLEAGSTGGVVRVNAEPQGAAAFIGVLAGEPTLEDLRRFRAAARAVVPAIAVQTGREPTPILPYVLATDVIHCPPGQGFPIEQIGRVLARRLGPDAVAFASRMPVLRTAVTDKLVSEASLRSALIGLLGRGKGARFPLLALSQSRLALDLAAAHGEEIGPERAPDVGAVVGTGLTMRALVRRLGLTGSRLTAGLTGYAATRALGEAMLVRFRNRPPA